eukprot:CAMPEP_0184454576 /NCGR_PEP_ID=MMETSP0740-20130409/20504_1 /TAXON_ID=385413 /ORGANISM="Thalassiosira miniscula, Strain CCMP1093" /LENGTH=30 /DNA_ID= /DNA_START= /DNA_END= /DNA_ORIENTATION=
MTIPTAAKAMARYTSSFCAVVASSPKSFTA